MTAKATKTRTPTVRPVQDEAELRRWTPEQVAANKWLPYRSARVIKEKCYKRLLFCHRDGGRITFTAEDLRRNNELGAQTPFDRATA